MNFKLGDTLICVNNDVVEKELTVGKEYKVIKERLDNIVIPYQVINDRGEQTGYFGYRFKLKEEKENMSNTFNLKDLKTGQRITFENGDKFIVFKDTPTLLRRDC